MIKTVKGIRFEGNKRMNPIVVKLVLGFFGIVLALFLFFKLADLVGYTSTVTITDYKIVEYGRTSVGRNRNAKHILILVSDKGEKFVYDRNIGRASDLSTKEFISLFNDIEGEEVKIHHAPFSRDIKDIIADDFTLSIRGNIKFTR